MGKKRALILLFIFLVAIATAYAQIPPPPPPTPGASAPTTETTAQTTQDTTNTQATQITPQSNTLPTPPSIPGILPQQDENVLATATKVLPRIGAENIVSISFSEPDLAITRMDITFSAAVNDFVVTAKSLKTLPVELTGLPSAYQFLELTKLNAQDSDFENVIIEFAVPKASANPLEVTLMRHVNGWQTLPTAHVGEEGNNYIYQAQTTGFSFFAINIEEKEDLAGSAITGIRVVPKQPQVQPTPPAAATPKIDTEANVKESEEPDEQSSAGGIIISTIIGLLAGAGLMVVALRIKEFNEPPESIKTYVEEVLNKGHSLESIKQHLTRQGWSRKHIEKAIMHVFRGKNN